MPATWLFTFCITFPSRYFLAFLVSMPTCDTADIEGEGVRCPLDFRHFEAPPRLASF